MDLGDEELKATRKLNGVAKESNIEEDIKILERFKNNEMQRDKLERDNRCGAWKIGDIYKHLELNTAINHILAERESDKKRIKELEEENKNRINREIVDYKRILKINNVKATEEDWKNDKSWIIAMLNVAEEDATRYKKELEDSIPKQKIRDVILKIINYKIPRATNNGYYYDYFVNQEYKEDFVKLFNKLLEDK